LPFLASDSASLEVDFQRFSKEFVEMALEVA